MTGTIRTNFMRANNSSMKRKCYKLARKDKLYRIKHELQEETREWQVEEEAKWDKWLDSLIKDSLVYQTHNEEESHHERKQFIVMKFGCDIVRLENTYSYNNIHCGTGECLVRYIGGKWLVLPCDLVMDDLSYLHSPLAWEVGSIGELDNVSFPRNPHHEYIKGLYTEFD